MNWQDYIGFVDIGGLTESTYHNVFFKKYSLIRKGNDQVIAPYLDFDFVSVDVPTGQSARDLLINLLCLYNKMTKLSPDETAEAILDWCNHNVHPYNTDKFNELFQDDSGFVNSKDVMALAEFSLDTFKKDLIALGTHFNFFYALDIIHWNMPGAAMNLYKKYDGWSEYSCFENIKRWRFRNLPETIEQQLPYLRSISKITIRNL